MIVALVEVVMAKHEVRITRTAEKQLKKVSRFIKEAWISGRGLLRHKASGKSECCLAIMTSPLKVIAGVSGRCVSIGLIE